MTAQAAKSAPSLKVYYMHTWSFDEEANNLATGNLPLFIATVIIIISLTLTIFSRHGWVQTRSTLGLLAFLTVVLGTGMGYGLSLYCGIIFATLQTFA
jgi:predicted RND superfamily exporter protein